MTSETDRYKLVEAYRSKCGTSRKVGAIALAYLDGKDTLIDALNSNKHVPVAVLIDMLREWQLIVKLADVRGNHIVSCSTAARIDDLVSIIKRDAK